MNRNWEEGGAGEMAVAEVNQIRQCNSVNR